MPDQSRVQHPEHTDGFSVADDLSDVQDELLRTARGLLRKKGTDLSIQTGDVLNSVLGDVLDSGNSAVFFNEVNWASRKHFFADMHRRMARKIIDKHRQKIAVKRGGGVSSFPLTDLDLATYKHAIGQQNLSEEFVDLVDLVDSLQIDYPEEVSIIWFKLDGLTNEEIAQLLEVSAKTVQRKLALLRVLVNELLAEA